MRKLTKRMLGYLLAITLFISDIPIVVNAEEDTDAASQSVETVMETAEEEIVSSLEEAEIISELTEKRDETTKYFAMSDGTTKACLYPQNIHYLDEGEYKEIDNTLEEDTEDGKTYYKNKKNSFSVTIPENYADDYIEFSDENGYVKFKLKGATNKKIEKIEKQQAKKNKDKTLVENVNDKAIFKSVKGNVDIEYDVTGNKLKETIVLYKKTKNAFVFEVQTSADRAVLNNDNIMQYLSLTPGRTYTFSGYIKTENVQSNTHGAALEVVVTGGNKTKHYLSEKILGTTDSEINNGFQHVDVSFTLEDGESVDRVTAGLFNASGTVYIDSLQLEEGNTANQINLIDNSSFERNSGNNTSPNGYVVNPAVSSVCNAFSCSGNMSCRIIGMGTSLRSIYQLVTHDGKAGETYTVGGWAKANAVPNHKADKLNDADFTLHVLAYNNDTEVDHIVIPFNEYVTDWQYVSKTFSLNTDCTYFKVYCSYDYNCNEAYFDNIFLYRDTMKSYSYDTKGNIVSTLDYANQSEIFQYNNNNTLAKLISPTGSSYEYIYDSNNNLQSARSSEGLFYDITYDSVGNAISSKTNNHNYSTSIESGKTYYIRLKGDGKYLTVADSGNLNGTNVIEESFSGGTNQKWKLEKSTNGYYVLSPQNAPNMALNVDGAKNVEDTNIQIYVKNNTSTQNFKIKPQTDFTYTITPECSPDGKLVTVNHSTSTNNVTIVSSQGINIPDQEWYFEDVENPIVDNIEEGTIYQFRARHSGKYIHLKDELNDIGTSTQQYECNFTNAQKFILNRYADTDYYTITNCIDQDKKLEISSDVNSIGFKYLRLGDNTISDSKLFKLEYNSSNQGFYIIPKIDETLALDVAYYVLANGASLIFTDKAPNVNRFFIAEKFSDTITTSATYQDNGNYPHTITDARGNTTTYTYDTSRGLQTGVIDAKGTATTYAYNALNDRLELVTSGNSTVSYQYETNGALKKIISPSGSTYNFIYDVFGRTSRIAIENTILSETQYKNNASSLVTRFDYGNGAYKTYEYDNQDRLISEGANGTTTRTYIYDKQGNIAQTTDHLTNVTTTYTHDLIGRISRIKSSDGQTTNFIYDTYNRLSLSKWSYGDTTLSSSYIYGDNSVENQKTGLIYGVKLNGTQQLGYEYDELARLQRRLLYTTTPFSTEYTYLEGASANTTTTLVKTVKNGNDTLEYTYDELGNITSVSKNGTIIEQYTYDALSQLISATYGGNTYTYSYDNGGNLTEIKKNGETIKTYTYGNSEWTDQLTGFNGETITYDAIGNPLIYRNGINFTWQNGRQLATITQNGSPLATYTYNADGLRNSKTVNGIITEYYWQEGILYGQKTGDESIFYLYDENGSAYGFIIKNPTEQSHYYYEFNLQGDIIGIIDSTGTRVVEYTYGAWGDLISVTGTLADTIGQKNPLRYKGYYYDAETGFYLTGTRYYDPEIGRFINADSLIDNRGIITQNLFQYCGNNPVNSADPSGNLFGAIVGIGLLVIGMVATLSGCSSKPAASPSKPSTPSKPSNPSSSSSSTTSPHIPTPQEKSYAATVYAEAGGQNKRSKQAVAHVMNNRIGTRSSWTDIESVISAKYQFDGYNSPMYQAAMNYYNNGICNNSIEQAAMDECLAVVIPIYSGAESDITGGALYFHSFANPSDWAYHNSYTQVYVPGTEKFWFYK